jgi:aminoglycoside phosphotransferase (APT) family kinase protein
MAATASPPSDPARLARFLAEASGANKVEIGKLELLAGGAIQHNWGFEAAFHGGSLAGLQALVLRTDAPTGVPSSLGRIDEFRVLQAVHAAGVTVPEPLFACPDRDVFGKPFFVMRRVTGTAQGRTITTDPAIEAALPRVAERLGRELARLQTIRPPRPDLAFLPPPEAMTPERQIAGFRAYLDQHPQPRPVLEWGIRWLEAHIPAPIGEPVLCHRDFRTGNYMLAFDSRRAEMTGILDWEFAGWGDPDEDIGWLCCKGWRFARLDREAGGIADRVDFYRGYEAEAGRRIDPERVRFWEILANIRWAIIALQQSDRYITGGERDLSLAFIGRRATECELELLMLLDPEGAPCGRAPELPPVERRDALRDLPEMADLLGFARDLLADELVPLLPPERQREAGLIATALSIATRELQAGQRWEREVREMLRDFYPRDESALFALHEAEGVAGSVRRLAADLCNGAFESYPSRQSAACAILWQLVIAKLREANPQFLKANGFA